MIDLRVVSNPQIEINENSIQIAIQKCKILNSKMNILLGIGGSGPTKRIPADKFKKFISLVIKDHECTFYLATGKNEDEQVILRDILSTYKDFCVALDNYSISEILPIIKSCKIIIQNGLFK